MLGYCLCYRQADLKAGAKYSNLSQDDLDVEVDKIAITKKQMGPNGVQAQLKGQGIVVQVC